MKEFEDLYKVLAPLSDHERMVMLGPLLAAVAVDRKDGRVNGGTLLILEDIERDVPGLKEVLAEFAEKWSNKT